MVIWRLSEYFPASVAAYKSADNIETHLAVEAFPKLGVVESFTLIALFNPFEERVELTKNDEVV